uniref:SCAN domain-containing protein 1 n=1 Tax=Ictidomys tridecemlineatus TaxID=43179 RepID=I3MTG6_ICTTR
MAATEPSLAATGNPAAAPPELQEGTDPEPNSAGSWISESSPPAPEPASANALPLGPAPPGSAPQAEAAPGSRPGPETFRQRFRQFRYQDAAGPREAFRQLRELSRQWLRPDIRTKEQMVEMLVQEQLLAILPEAARARRLRRRADVRITG